MSSITLIALLYLADGFDLLAFRFFVNEHCAERFAATFFLRVIPRGCNFKLAAGIGKPGAPSFAPVR
jgi:hypothetical protein